MHIVRVFRSSVLLGGLTCFALSVLPGCDSGSSDSENKSVIKVDKAEVENRAAKIRELYKTNPPSKGPGGQLPADSKAKEAIKEAPAGTKAESK